TVRRRAAKHVRLHREAPEVLRLRPEAPQPEAPRETGRTPGGQRARQRGRSVGEGPQHDLPEHDLRGLLPPLLELRPDDRRWAQPDGGELLALLRPRPPVLRVDP